MSGHDLLILSCNLTAPWLDRPVFVDYSILQYLPCPCSAAGNVEIFHVNDWSATVGISSPCSKIRTNKEDMMAMNTIDRLPGFL